MESGGEDRSLNELEMNSTDRADIKQVIRQLSELPPAALQEVADFIAFLYQRHVRLTVDERVARRRANRWLLDNVGNLVMASRPVLTHAGDR